MRGGSLDFSGFTVKSWQIFEVLNRFLGHKMGLFQKCMLRVYWELWAGFSVETICKIMFMFSGQPTDVIQLEYIFSSFVVENQEKLIMC